MARTDPSNKDAAAQAHWRRPGVLRVAMRSSKAVHLCGLFSGATVGLRHAPAGPNAIGRHGLAQVATSNGMLQRQFCATRVCFACVSGYNKQSFISPQICHLKYNAAPAAERYAPGPFAGDCKAAVARNYISKLAI